MIRPIPRSGLAALASFVAVAFIAGTAITAPADSEIYGSTDFVATGSAEAHPVFIKGLLQLHNFEYPDARETFQLVQEIDPTFTMAYWGEALSWENPLWHRYNIENSRAAMAKLGTSPEERIGKAQTQREKAYLASLEILFGDGSQQEREIAYSAALQEIYEEYPDDLDAAALYALSILTTSHGGRDFTLYMRSAAITEAILSKNPRHPGALHYNIHSFDDPIHAPLGLRAADVYAEVAPSAVHALHMGSHIYFALGMWEKGTERNLRSFEEAISRRPSDDAPFGSQAYHALTWLVYSLTQQGKSAEASEKLALIEDQVNRFGDASHRQNFITARASYIVDTQAWGSHFAGVDVSHEGLGAYFVATDQYVKGLVALKRGDTTGARASLASLDGSKIESRDRRVMAPRLLHLALDAQIALAEGENDQALTLMEEAANLENGIPAVYGPAVPVQPMSELLADTYLILGDSQLAEQHYQRSLQGAVGRERSLNGLQKAAH